MYMKWFGLKIEVVCLKAFTELADFTRYSSLCSAK